MLGCNAGVYHPFKGKATSNNSSPLLWPSSWTCMQRYCPNNTICPKSCLPCLEGCAVCIRRVLLNRTNSQECMLNVWTGNMWLPIRAGGTRWTGHMLLALDKFITGYSALRFHLEHDNTNTSEVIPFIFISVISVIKEVFQFPF